MANRAEERKTNLSGEAAYTSFMPSPLPPDPAMELDGEIIKLFVKANKQLAVLEKLVARIPNVNLFISTYVRKKPPMFSTL